jgi:hypothetical protein
MILIEEKPIAVYFARGEVFEHPDGDDIDSPSTHSQYVVT